MRGNRVMAEKVGNLKVKAESIGEKNKENLVLCRKNIKEHYVG